MIQLHRQFFKSVLWPFLLNVRKIQYVLLFILLGLISRIRILFLCHQIANTLGFVGQAV